MPHVPPAAAPVSTRVELVMEAPAGAYPEAVLVDPRREPTPNLEGWRVALAQESSEGESGLCLWRAEILLPREPTVLRYHFALADGTTVRERRQREGIVKPLYGVWEEQDFQVAVYDPAGAPPAWVHGSVIYQIFPDRFAYGDPTNVFRGGMTYDREPIYPKWGIPPEHPPKGRDFYGGDLRGVINKLDYLQELGVTCLYFTPIFASPTNHRYDALDYMLVDPRLGTEDDLRELIAEAERRGMRILLDGVFNHCSKDSIYFEAARSSKLSPYYRWFTFERWPDKWVGWADVSTMPEFVECPEVEEFFFGEGGVAQRWLSLGTAGWRTDVTPWITDEFWRRFRRAMRRSYPDAYLVAEDWGDATHRLVGDTFDATMNYRFAYSVAGFAAARVTASELDDRLETLRRDTPQPQFLAQMNLLGSHDTPRILTELGGSRERVMLAAALQLAYPGVPMIYYGDEAGVEGDYAEAGRGPFPWDAPDTELQSFYKLAINARRTSPALSIGDVSTVWIDDLGGYGIMRRSADEAVVALFNAGFEPLDAVIRLDLGEQTPRGEWTDLLGQLSPVALDGGVLHVTLPPECAAWLRAPVTHG